MRVMRLVRLNALTSMFIPTSSELRSPFLKQLLSTVHQILLVPHILRLECSSAFPGFSCGLFFLFLHTAKKIQATTCHEVFLSTFPTSSHSRT